jgi:phosphate transport system protein
MSPADSADPGPRESELRLGYHAELEQLRLQTEMMGVLVDQNLERMRNVLGAAEPDEAARLARVAVEADDGIDDMNVSLTERCHQLLARENPVASDLRLVVSVIRVTGEFERVGDLSLRVVKLAPELGLLQADPRCYDILCAMAGEAVELFRTALRAWATLSFDVATDLALGSSRWMDLYYEQLTSALVQLEAPDAVRIAMDTLVAGRALERIADHAAIIGARLRYMLTGDPDHLAAEVR